MKAPEDVVRKFWDAYSSRHDLGAALGLVDPDIVHYNPFYPQGRKGKESFGKLFEAFLRAIPDIHVEISNIIAKGDIVAVEAVGRGTFKGPLELPTGTAAPNNRHFESPFATFVRVNANGLIAEWHVYEDFTTLFQQLGVKPPSSG